MGCVLDPPAGRTTARPLRGVAVRQARSLQEAFGAVWLWRRSTGPGRSTRRLVESVRGIWAALPLVLLALLPMAAGAQPAAEQTSDGSSPDALIVFADAANFQNAGEYPLAAEEWANFLKRFPDDPRAVDARFYLGVCQLQQQKYPQAIALFQQVLKQSDAKYAHREEALLNLGTAQYSGGVAQQPALLEASAETFRLLATDFPDGKFTDQALFFRGEALYLVQQWEEAATAYRNLIDRFPRSTLIADALYALGTTYQRMEEPGKAEETFERFLHDFSDHQMAAEVQLRRAETLLEQEKWREAADGFARAANTKGFAAADHALFRQAYCLAQDEKYGDAAKVFLELPKRFPESEYRWEAVMAAGRAFYRARNFGQAEQALSQIPADHSFAREALHWRTRIRLQQGQDQEALELLRPLLKELLDASSPGGPFQAELMLDAADVLYASPEHRQQAINVYHRVAEEFPDHPMAPQALYNAAYASLEINQGDQAIEMARQLLSRFPTHELSRDAHQVLAEALSRSGQFLEGIRQYAEVLRDAPPNHPLVPFALYGRGWGYLQMKQLNPATSDLRQLLQQYPDHSLVNKARYALATALQQNGHLEAAVEELSQLLSADDLQGEQRADALYLRALCHIELQQYDLAVEDLKSLRAGFPRLEKMDRVLYELAWAHKNLGDDEAAVEHFAALTREVPGSPLAGEAYYHQGEHFYEQQNYPQAAAAYRHALEVSSGVEPMREKAQYKLAWSLFRQQDLDGAGQAFEQLARTWPDGDLAQEALFMRGECLFRKEDFQQAVVLFRQAQATDRPLSNPNLQMLLLLHRAQAAGQVGQWQEALGCLNQLIEQHAEAPIVPQATFEKGRALQNLGKLDEALEQFREAAENRRSELGAQARFMAGEVLFAKKDFPEAVREFQRVMLGYGGKEATQAIRLWQAKAGIEAARCCELIASTQEDTSESKKWLQQAVKFFQYVATEHPQSPEARAARNQLQKYGV